LTDPPVSESFDVSEPFGKEGLEDRVCSGSQNLCFGLIGLYGNPAGLPGVIRWYFTHMGTRNVPLSQSDDAEVVSVSKSETDEDEAEQIGVEQTMHVSDNGDRKSISKVSLISVFRTCPPCIHIETHNIFNELGVKSAQNLTSRD